jgi:3-hydroxyacyl-[acyl-carrier-protein] dehydratase
MEYYSLDIEEIKKILPHRYPFLLIDKVIERIKGQSGLGLKNVTINEPYFKGHFPDSPIVPGVLIIESCAQLLGLVCADENASAARHQFLASVKDFNFKSSVVPGDTMYIEVKVIENSFKLIQGTARVKTRRGLVASGIIVNTNIK